VFAKYLLAALAAAGIGLQARAADLETIQRVIRKEPVYKSAPKYCLLVFGEKADTQIWMVLDGNTLYVDRNGNGDLTEPGETWTNGNGPHFTINQIVERDGTKHETLEVNSRNDGKFLLRLTHKGEQQQYVGFGRMERPAWGDKPVNAPIIHFNGPLTLERYGPIYTVPRGAAEKDDSRRFKLRLMLGTPGLGQGTFASFDEVCSENLGPIQADIEYPNAMGGDVPTKQRLELYHDG
jgi:hypothetical protein